jgi:hypothetical protein
MTASYELSGLPRLAVRAGHALQRWGAVSALPRADDHELRRRREALREEHRASAARDAAIGGMYRAPH